MDTTLEQIRRDLASERYTKASYLLSSNVHTLLDKHGTTQILELLGEVSAGKERNHPDIVYAGAIIASYKRDIQNAKEKLNKAKAHYLDNITSPDRVALCLIALAGIHRILEDPEESLIYLEEAKKILNANNIQDEDIRRRYDLLLASIFTRIGRLKDAIPLLQEAEKWFKKIENHRQLFSVYFNLSYVNGHLGSIDKALEFLDLTEGSQVAGQLDLYLAVRYNNLKAPLVSYKGELQEAIRICSDLLRDVSSREISKYKVYANINAANIYCALNEFDSSLDYYKRTRDEVIKQKLHRFEPLVDVREGWLYFRMSEIEKAQEYMRKGLAGLEEEERVRESHLMDYQVPYAVLHIHEGNLAEAERLLLHSLEYFSRSGDELLICPINFYLALIQIKKGNNNKAKLYLDESFGWLQRKGFYFFRAWWHPQLVSKGCKFALDNNIQWEAAKAIFINGHLGDSGLHILRAAVFGENAYVRARAGEVLEEIGDTVYSELDFIPDLQTRKVLEEYLRKNKIRRSKLRPLFDQMNIYTKRKNLRPKHVALFCLVIDNVPRSEIKKILDYADRTISQGLKDVFESFDLPGAKSNVATDRERLRTKARELGYIS